MNGKKLPTQVSPCLLQSLIDDVTGHHLFVTFLLTLTLERRPSSTPPALETDCGFQPAMKVDSPSPRSRLAR